MARHYGGNAREAPELEFAQPHPLVNGGGAIFAGTPETQTVWESHNDEVHVVPRASTSRLPLLRAKCKAWRTKTEPGLASNSTQR